MAQGQRTNRALVQQARQGLDRLKQEVASELGIPNYQGYLGEVPSRLNGAVGGNMVRRMIAAAEQSLIQQAAQQVQTGFRQGLQQGTQQQFGTPFTSQQQVPNPQQVQVPPAQ